ncbi:hypothetical protein CQA53_10885 [Helicobacter didelphidarum]|uniref:Uncharacterized protein n=1 Tax=Helicobacter didelphidarum TaxID=2040648 RepID=A0A3D8I6N7_9HELI|nr:hypothetical protein [Helicobacter didelphidarum]RDU60404.1 hypothetical protein CQA53_10885 [Helicobacter didelphidarum]
MKKIIVTMFILYCIITNLWSQSLCLKPIFGYSVETKIRTFANLGMAYCLGVKDKPMGYSTTFGRDFEAIEEAFGCRNKPKIIDVKVAFEELKEYMEIPTYIQNKDELDAVWVGYCFSIYDSSKYHDKVKEIFYKYCKDCK